ncbi:unnamed protein product [Enterobius vermicularis]|uniref:MATH domain-containing protein n=1 Tax=Enterobius vermicularis TaxID=51028 RepID=A0A0N4UTT6_ENTVE|nr:unnamed protein product [Enterobius vermicularis]
MEEENENLPATSQQSLSSTSAPNELLFSSRRALNEGFLTLIISNVWSLDHEVESPKQDVFGLEWFLSAKMEEQVCGTEVGNQDCCTKYLGLHLYCGKATRFSCWSCTAIFQLTLKHRNEQLNYVKTHKYNFSQQRTEYSVPTFIKMEDLANLNKGYTENGKVSIEAHIVVKKVKGTR